MSYENDLISRDEYDNRYDLEEVLISSTLIRADARRGKSLRSDRHNMLLAAAFVVLARAAVFFVLTITGVL